MNLVFKPVSRRLALVVDDEPINCVIMQSILEKMGFETAIAHDGYEAIEAFELLAPDFVFMDVIMPHMDGREAARCIKSMTSGRFTPIVFLTALDDPEEVHACIEAGGDDYLSKPVDPRLLRTRIYSLERIRSLYQKLSRQHDELLFKIAEEQENEALANRVFLHAVSAHNEPISGLDSYSRPASCFSGDLVLSCRLGQGGIRVMLGDFTGHGLAAAIGALPTSELFHAMTRQGRSIPELLTELNHKLCRILPDDRFMAAVLIDIDPVKGEFCYWSGGMPPFVYKSKDQLIYHSSSGLPLGILENYDFVSEVGSGRLTDIERILLMSDGLLDVRNQEGATFSSCGFKDLMDSWASNDGFFSALDERLDQHCQNRLPDDDVTLVSIDLEKALAVLNVSSDQSADLSPEPEGWEWALASGGGYLLDHSEVITALTDTKYLQDWPAEQAERLQTLFGELYNNAIEHGLFGLDSSLKSTPDGFHLYYEKRQALFDDPPPGQIRIQMTFLPRQQGGCLRLVVQDPGKGYDLTRLSELEQHDDPSRFWGRGMQLVRSLADNLIIHPPGNRVEAELRW
ncbi:ATP-binding SpoIIE family protein phosphatase [Marinospirillum alkaliphilum]|uniref:ATP-binding SpoIIE family protein phosphatase n=1 Tax=Marinospirillum alkaliphilum TaxID=148454 RepID=UPI0015A5C593|nr:fused response regulator/phosphatase [Marinospirillum alkaliphilum]